MTDTQSPLLQRPDSTDTHVMMMLFSMKPDLIKALIEGRVLRTSKSRLPGSFLPDQTKGTTMAEEKAEKRPCIYGHFWGSEIHGKPPTGNQLLHLIAKAQLYYKPSKMWMTMTDNLGGHLNSTALATANVQPFDQDSDDIATAVDNFRLIDPRIGYTPNQRRRGRRRFALNPEQVDDALTWLRDLQEELNQMSPAVCYLTGRA